MMLVRSSTMPLDHCATCIPLIAPDLTPLPDLGSLQGLQFQQVGTQLSLPIYASVPQSSLLINFGA